jgi:Type II secretory pathway, component PulF
MSAAGVPLVEALESVAGACGNIIYSEAVLKNARRGVNRSTASIRHAAVQYLAQHGDTNGGDRRRIGRDGHHAVESGRFFDEEVDNLVDNLSSLMEPIIMCVLGILVGGLIVAMYLPIFKMGAAVG